MSIQVSLKLKLSKIVSKICVKYNTFEKATYDQYLVSSIALNSKNENEAFEYIDDITGSGSLNSHFKNLYEDVSSLTEEQLRDVMSDSMYPMLKIDKSNRYDYYPDLDVSVFNNKVYEGNFGEYPDVIERLYITEKVIEKTVEKANETNRPEPYLILIEDNKVQVKLADKFIDIIDEKFQELFVNELDNLDKYKGTIHNGAEGFGWNTLTNSVINNMFSNINYYYDDEGNHYQIRNDNVRKTSVSEVAGLYIYREEIIPYERNKSMCEKVIEILFDNNSINEFKTKSLLNILSFCDELIAQKVVNYILSRKESKEFSLFGLDLIEKGIEKNWLEETLISCLKFASNSQIGKVYKINQNLGFNIEQLLYVDINELNVNDKARVKEYLDDLKAKRDMYKSIIGEVTASSLRENIKSLKATEDTKRFTKLANELIGHSKINIDEATAGQVDNLLKKALELKELKQKLQAQIGN